MIQIRRLILLALIRGIAGVIMMQYLPFTDAKALATYDTFERGAYQFLNAER